MKRPNQATILKILSDPRINRDQVCAHAGINRYTVINRHQGKVKKEMTDNELDRLWNSIPDKLKMLQEK